MNKINIVLLILTVLSCKEVEKKQLSAQEIVDKSIEVSGGDLYHTSMLSFNFRDRYYISEPQEKQHVLKRVLKNDTMTVLDIKAPKGFQRFVNDSLVVLSDSLSNTYSNSVNSVHYFSKLPYGLNDPAVSKELLGEITIKNEDYYKLKVSFSQEGGGVDFDDVYVYWFNKKTFKPDYLAYVFQVNGGGMRFREAYNERYVNGIRFVDYTNLKSVGATRAILDIDSLYINNELEFLSKIELKDIQVNQDSYN